jgi:ectoine hydroxylase-related dioxygenase (phytanoyl-CoA dioxygenase family)
MGLHVTTQNDACIITQRSEINYGAEIRILNWNLEVGHIFFWNKTTIHYIRQRNFDTRESFKFTDIVEE